MTTKFKVGDKVKVLAKSNESSKIQVGATTTITSVNDGWPYPYSVEADAHYLYRDSLLESANDFPRSIDYSDIQNGDTIKVTKNSYGVETVHTFKVESKAPGFKLNAEGGGLIDAYRATIVLIDREKKDKVGTVYSYASVKGTFIEYYIMTERGLIKAINVSDPNAKIESIPLSKLTKLPTEQ
jgi:hypothetical protein